MPAHQSAHGVITISAPARQAPVAESYVPTVAATSHAVSTGAPPEPVVQHKTVAEIQAEATAVASAAEQLISDAANSTPAA